MPNKNIEIEYRSRFDRKTFGRVRNFLSRHGRRLGKDDKEVFFYVGKNKVYKVVKNISSRTAKIVLKDARIEKKSSFREVEIPIDLARVSEANEFVKSIPGLRFYHDIVRRENFSWRKVEIALKYSQTWGYHAELEVMLSAEDKKKTASKRIRNVASELGIQLMESNDIARFLREAHTNY